MMSLKNRAIPGIIGPLKNYQGWENKVRHGKRTIEEKRETVIRGIERSLRGEKGGHKLEHLDRAQGRPVIRVLYASIPLPLFDGEAFAAIDPSCNREQLWGAIIDQIRAGSFDDEILAVSRRLSASLEEKRAKRAPLKAV